MSDKNDLGSRLLILYSLIWYLSVQLHEAAHWGTAKLLGLDFFLGFNRWTTAGSGSDWQRLAAAAAGPIMTLALVIVGLVLVYRQQERLGKRIGVLLVAGNSVTALVNHLLYFIRGSQGDERWIAQHLQVPEVLVRTPFIVFYLVALVLGFKTGEASFRKPKWVVSLLLLPMGLSGLLVALDVLAWNGMEQGNALFQPIGGISAMVLVVNALAVLGLVYTLTRGKRDSASKTEG